MPRNYRVAWAKACALGVLPDGSVDVQVEDQFYGGLITRADAQHLANAILRAQQQAPLKFCPDCRSTALTPIRETLYDEGAGSECKACGWKGPCSEVSDA